MSNHNEKYNKEFKQVESKFNDLNFKDLFEEETGFTFNKARQAPCPFDNCSSGKSGRKGSDGAFKYYPSSNMGTCFSCGQSAGNTKLLQILHGFSYPELIHYVGQKYHNTYLDNPSIKVAVKPSEKKLSAYKKPTKKEILAEKAKQFQTFNYIKDMALKNNNYEAKEYLQSRGIETELPVFKLDGYKGKSSGVVFFDTEKRFLNERYFKVEEGGNKTFSFGEMKNNVYADTFIEKEETVLITEGVLNSLSLHQTGTSSIAIFATTNYFDDVEKFSEYLTEKHVVIAFDFDKNYAGQKAAIKHAHFIAENFKTKSLSIILFPEDKDANDLLQEKTLESFLENQFNYVFPKKNELKKMTEAIKANYHTYKPELKPNNYYNRPAVKKEEPDGHFQYKAFDKTPDEFINKFKGYTGINKNTFSECHLVFVEEYTIISNETAHTHKSIPANPILIIKDTKHILRPFSHKPYKKIDSYNDELFQHGMDQLETASLEHSPDGEEESVNKKEPNLARATLVYNFIDFVNLTAIGENPIYIQEKLSYELRTDILEFAKEIIQVPANNFREKLLSKKISNSNINVKTLEIPIYKKSVTEYLQNIGEKDTYIYKRLINTALPLKFWSFETKKNIFNLNIIILRNFLTKFGYFKYAESDNDNDYSYIKINGRIVTKIDKDNFSGIAKTFVDNYLLNRGENVTTRHKVSLSNNLTEVPLSQISTINLDFENSGSDYQNLFFKDGNVWRITKEGIITQNQKSLKKYLWEEELLDYPSNILEPPFVIFHKEKYAGKLQEIKECTDPQEKLRLFKEVAKFKDEDRFDIEIKDKNNYFLQFLFGTSFAYFEKAEDKGFFAKPTDFWYEFPKDLLTKEEIDEIKLHLISKISWLGYNMKSFRQDDHDFGTIILDAINNDDKNKSAAGGGKSLITRGIGKIKTKYRVSAQNEKFTDDKHRYSGYEGERIVVIDDMHLKSKIGNILTDISDGITVDRKHKQSFEIPFRYSPKIILTRNYVDDEKERVDRRLGRMFVYPFFHDGKSGRFKTKRKPSDWFGRMLYSSDNESQKSDLINFFAYACVSNFKFKEINPPSEDLTNWRKLNMIGEPLLDFLDDYYDINSYGYTDRVILFKNFIEDKKNVFTPYQRTRMYSSPQKFKNLVQDYCQIRDLVFNPEEFVNDKVKQRIKRKSQTQQDANGNPKNTEHFYIAPNEQFVSDLKEDQGEEKGEQSDIPF